MIEALLENDLRRNLTPVSRARGYRRLIDAGRTVKGVAERLQTTQTRVREHRRARAEASARLEGIEDRIGELSVEQVDQAEQDLDNAWAGWTPRYGTLRQLLADRRQQLADASDRQADGGPEPAPREQ